MGWGAGARATIAMEEVPMTMFVLPMKMGVLSIVAAAPGGRVEVPTTTAPLESGWTCWPPIVGRDAGVAVAKGMAIEELPMMMKEGPTEMSVLEMVRGAAPGIRVVPATATPPATAVIVWPPMVATADASAWNCPPAFWDWDGGSALLLTLLAGSAGLEAGGSTALPPAPCCRRKVGVVGEGVDWLPPLPVLVG